MSNNLTTINDQEVVSYNESQLKLIKDLYARGATNDEFQLMLYMSKKYNLDILSKQIWCVKFGTAAAQIYCGRDGFLQVAHTSGKFDGMKTEIKKIDEPFAVKGFKCEDQFVATCTVYRVGMTHPIQVEVYESEYSTGQSLWTSKRRTMIGKVAESQCLRKAFSISGLYSPEEMGEEPNRVNVDPSRIIGEGYEESPSTIDDLKVQAIKALAAKKGIIQKSVCAAYELEKFDEMSFEIWSEAMGKLELRPDKIVIEKDPLGDF